MSDIDHTLTHEPVCPHCGAEQSDAWEWMPGESGYTECSSCDEQFFWERIITVEYTTLKPNTP